MEAESIAEPSVLFPVVSAFIHELIKVDPTASSMLADLANVETDTYSMLNNQNPTISPAALQVKWHQLVTQILETVIRVNKMRPAALIPQHFGTIKTVIQQVHSLSPLDVAAKKQHNQSFLQLKKEVAEIERLLPTANDILVKRLTSLRSDIATKYSLFFETTEMDQDAISKAIRDIRRGIDQVLRLLNDEKQKTDNFVAPPECRMISRFFNDLRLKADKNIKARSKTPPARIIAANKFSLQTPSRQAKPHATAAVSRAKTPPSKRQSLSNIPKRLSPQHQTPTVRASSSAAKIGALSATTSPPSAGSSPGRPTSSHSSTSAKSAITPRPYAAYSPRRTPTTGRLLPSPGAKRVLPTRGVSPGATRVYPATSVRPKASSPKPAGSVTSKSSVASSTRTPSKSPGARSSKATPLRTKPSQKREKPTSSKTRPEKKKTTPNRKEKPAVEEQKIEEPQQVVNDQVQQPEPVEASTPKVVEQPKVNDDINEDEFQPVQVRMVDVSPAQKKRLDDLMDSETDRMVLAVEKAQTQTKGRSPALEKLQRDLIGGDLSSSDTAPSKKIRAISPLQAVLRKQASPQKRIDTESAGTTNEKEKGAYLRVFKSFERRLLKFEPLLATGKKIKEFLALSKDRDYDKQIAAQLLSDIDEKMSGMGEMTPNEQKVYNAARTLSQLSRLIEIDISGKFEEANSSLMREAFRNVEKQLSSIRDPRMHDFIEEQLQRLKDTKPLFLEFLNAQLKREDVQKMRNDNQFLEQDLDRIRANIALIKDAISKSGPVDVRKLEQMSRSDLLGAFERLNEELMELERTHTTELEALTVSLNKSVKKRDAFISELSEIHSQIAQLHRALADSGNSQTVSLGEETLARDTVMSRLTSLLHRESEICQAMEGSA